MKKRLGNVNVNISNRAFYSILLLSISILVVSVVLAFGTQNPSTFGHSAKELDLSSGVAGNAVFLGDVNVSGNIKATGEVNAIGGVKVGDVAASCNTNNKGLLKFNSASNQAEICDGTAWASIGGSGYVGLLVNSVHNSTDCTNSIFGTIVDDGSGNKFCKIEGSACPSGWTKYQQWSRTSSASCIGENNPNDNPCGQEGTSCSTNSHGIFANTATETCSYRWEHPWASQCIENNVCYANVITIGCY